MMALDACSGFAVKNPDIGVQGSRLCWKLPNTFLIVKLSIALGESMFRSMIVTLAFLL